MARQTINVGAAANDRTGDTLRAAGLKMNANFTELYNILGGEVVGPNTTSLTDSGFDIIGVTARTKIGAADPTQEISIDFPDSAGNIVVDVATQTLRNKTVDSADLNNPSILNLSIKDNDFSHTYNFVAGALTANQDVGIPSLTADDTLVLNDAAGTLTNKTLFDPIIQQARVHQYLADSIGNSVISFTDDFTSSRNNIKVSDTATGSSPIIEAIGADNNVNLILRPKGIGVVVADKVGVQSATAANGTAADQEYGYIILTGTSSGTVQLADGTFQGETKIFTRVAGGTGTVSLTPDTLAHGTSINFDPLDSVHLIWNTTSGWIIVGGYGYAVV